MAPMEGRDDYTISFPILELWAGLGGVVVEGPSFLSAERLTATVMLIANGIWMK